MKTIEEIAAEAGTTVVEIVEDYGNAVFDLAGATFIGETMLAVGLPGGQSLVDDSASLMADMSGQLGIDIADLGPLETGAPTAVIRAAAKYLKNGAQVVAQRAASSSAGVIKAILAIGLVGTSYMFFTEDLQVRLAHVEKQKYLGSLAVAKMDSAQAAAAVESLGAGGGFKVPWWGWLGLAGGAYFAWARWAR